ncbi:MAG: hypothetical protein P9L93_00100 [Candidatus Gorgyraea atricola]|nr:hypothetical protein [Candidatus Gorgyraea atricola]
MKSIKTILILILVLVIAGRYSIVFAAQDDTDTQTSVVSLTIPHVCRLVISQPDSSITLDQDVDAEQAFNDGYAELDAGKPSLKVSANKNWKLSARSSGFTVNGSYTKDIGDLQLKDAGSAHVTNGFNDYKSLSAVDQDIATYSGGVKNEDHPCQYKILLDYENDIPGEYTATVTYTLSTDAS